MEETSNLFNYTSGRYLINDSRRRLERHRVFNISEFKRLAALSVNRNVDDVIRFEKLAEGGFNRTFLLTLRDGHQFVGRVPYPSTEPKGLVIASEVATMDFLRYHGLPIPKIYDYSTTPDNTAGTEYVFMELVAGTNLGDIWFKMPDKARISTLTKIVELESRLFSLTLPASGSVYYTKDLQAKVPKIGIPNIVSATGSSFCLGPDLALSLWYGKRLKLQVNRGPYLDPSAALVAGARKEIMYLEKFGKPLHPIQRIRRETYNYQKQSHSEHLDLLNKYLLVAPYLIPGGNDTLKRPTIRHPDLHPNNVFVSKDLEITGLIDWQHCSILPLFLQCDIPNSFQNWDDDISDSLQTPTLPENFDDLSEREQFEQIQLFRRRQLHYYYVIKTKEVNPIHYEALDYDFGMLRRKLFQWASEPWEGDNITLKRDLISLTRLWSRITQPQSLSTGADARIPCPITFEEEEKRECERLSAAQVEADEQFQDGLDVVGATSDGWVPAERYEEARRRERKIRADCLEGAETDEERETIREHWLFDDFDDSEVEEYR